MFKVRCFLVSLHSRLNEVFHIINYNNTIMTINEFNFAGKKAIVRVDFNVPLDENGKITDEGVGRSRCFCSRLR